MIFGVSHIYRLEDVITSNRNIDLQGILPVLFQVCFTSLFGLYVGYVFVVTGSLYAVIVLHGFCNFMGLPNLKFLSKDQPAYRYKNAILFTYIAGIVMFFTLIYLMMSPEFFKSWHSELIERKK